MTLSFSPCVTFSQNVNNRELQDQSPREQFVQKPSALEEIWKAFHASYFVSMMGPKLTGSGNETYNLFLQDTAPIQLFHVIRGAFDFSPDVQFFVSRAAVQNMVDGVVGDTGAVYNHNFEWFDPDIGISLPHSFDFYWASVGTSISFSLPVTQASKDIGRITAITISQGWNLKGMPSPWSLSLNLFLRPQFYKEMLPRGVAFRQTFMGSIGHFLSYQLSPVVSFSMSTAFDVEHRTPEPKGPLHLGPNLDDRARLGMTLTPNVWPMNLSLGGYFQWLIWRPSGGTSIIGADLSIGF